VKGEASSERRGYDKDQGGGADGAPEPSQPLALSDVLKTGLWSQFGSRYEYEYQAPLLQPAGGMDAIARALGREVSGLIRFNSKVTAIKQNGSGVSVAFEEAKTPGRTQTATADWCICTIPLTILSQIEMDVSPAMHAAIDAVPYNSSVKVGLQFKRRFWEEDDEIYGGITFTDLPIRMISYPSSELHSSGKGVLLAAYTAGTYGYEFTALSPAERVSRALEYGSAIHPQYAREFENGVSVAWLRVPSAMGCFGLWSESARAQHYKNLCAIDGRIVLAGEHASYVNAWQEGAVLSALDAMSRLHRRVIAG
jgi:monoamine oxidase